MMFMIAFGLVSLSVSSPHHSVRAPATSFCDSGGWSKVFADEFNDKLLDNTTWTIDFDGGDSRVRDAKGTSNNVYIQNGSLVLQSSREQVDGYNFTTGAIRSKGNVSWKGLTRVCVNAILPGSATPNTSDGIWPAHWMMPDDKACWPSNGEIDIMEMVNGDGMLHGTYHWQTDGHCGNQPVKHPSISNETRLSADWGTAYHEYAVEYSPTHIAFAIDGKVYNNITTSDKAANGDPGEFFDVAYYIILNTAIGGPWPKPVNPSTTFPIYHRIDYVRVAQPSAN